MFIMSCIFALISGAVGALTSGVWGAAGRFDLVWLLCSLFPLLCLGLLCVPSLLSRYLTALPPLLYILYSTTFVASHRLKIPLAPLSSSCKPRGFSKTPRAFPKPKPEVSTAPSSLCVASTVQLRSIELDRSGALGRPSGGIR